jgi:hypothetical protein
MMVPFKGEKDVCETLAEFAKKPDVAKKLDQYKISKKCPVAKVSSVCRLITCLCAHYWNGLLPDGV